MLMKGSWEVVFPKCGHSPSRRQSHQPISVPRLISLIPVKVALRLGHTRGLQAARGEMPQPRCQSWSQNPPLECGACVGMGHRWAWAPHRSLWCKWAEH